MRAHTGTRTLNTRIRNPLLCPIELYGRKTRGTLEGVKPSMENRVSMGITVLSTAPYGAVRESNPHRGSHEPPAGVWRSPHSGSHDGSAWPARSIIVACRGFEPL